MSVIDRLVLVLVRVTGMWALGTRFESLATARPRVLPADDVDIQQAHLADIDHHLAEVGRGLRNWLFLGVALIVFSWVGAEGVLFWIDTLMLSSFASHGVPFERYVAYRDGVMLIWLLVVLVLFLIWVAWILRFVRYSQVDPLYEATDRLTVALKRDSLSSDSLAVLRSHRPSATTQAYFGRLWPRDA